MSLTTSSEVNPDMKSGARDVVVALEHVSKRFGDVEVLHDINLEIRKGESIAILGPSGSGKSTLLRCINFMNPYDQGRIRVNGRLIGFREKNGRLVPDKETNVNALRAQVGMVFQRFNLFPHRTVLENLLEGPVYVLKLPMQEALERAVVALTRVGLLDKSDFYPSRLSGGQQQRVAIARSLCMEPEIMLFDEVTSALDPELVGEVTDVVKQLAEEGLTMLSVTHQVGFARQFADRVIFMEDGRILHDLPAGTFFEHPPSERIERYLHDVRNG